MSLKSYAGAPLASSPIAVRVCTHGIILCFPIVKPMLPPRYRVLFLLRFYLSSLRRCTFRTFLNILPSAVLGMLQRWVHLNLALELPLRIPCEPAITCK
jgi:hypothetical protein